MVIKATNLIISNGILANVVNKPSKICTPQRTSNEPTKLPKNASEGKPIFSNTTANLTLAHYLAETLRQIKATSFTTIKAILPPISPASTSPTSDGKPSTK